VTGKHKRIIRLTNASSMYAKQQTLSRTHPHASTRCMAADLPTLRYIVVRFPIAHGEGDDVLAGHARSVDLAASFVKSCYSY
jgi:hypothetical protein